MIIELYSAVLESPFTKENKTCWKHIDQNNNSCQTSPDCCSKYLCEVNENLPTQQSNHNDCRQNPVMESTEYWRHVDNKHIMITLSELSDHPFNTPRA